MEKYNDCYSCAFSDQNHPICDMCDDADQWEPAYEEEDSLVKGKKSIIKIKKFKEKIAA